MERILVSLLDAGHILLVNRPVLAEGGNVHTEDLDGDIVELLEPVAISV